MTPDDPRHGSYRGWSQHDRDNEPECAACGEARRAYHRRRPHLAALGKPLRGPVGHHAYQNVVALSELTQGEWMRATGLSATVYTHVLNGGPTINTRSVVRERIEALDVAHILTSRLTHQGTVRRVQALTCLGYSGTEQAELMAISPETILLLQTGKAVFSSHKTRTKVADIYAELEHQPARPVTKITARAFNKAQKGGWLPPMAWTNIDHDPTPRRGSHHKRRTDVDEAVIVRVLAGERMHTTPAEKDEIVRRWTARGGSLNDLERRLGINTYRHKEAS